MNKQTDDKGTAEIADTVSQSELIEPLGAEEELCVNCKYFENQSQEDPSDDDYEAYGPCRRYPPVFYNPPYDDYDGMPWAFAFVERANFVSCGEYVRSL